MRVLVLWLHDPPRSSEAADISMRCLVLSNVCFQMTIVPIAHGMFNAIACTVVDHPKIGPTCS